MKRTDILTVFILILTLAACEKGQLGGCADEELFCEQVEDDNLGGTLPLIKNFLAKVIGDNQNQKLAKLKDWLECKHCVEEVDIPCMSCIIDPPPPRTIGVDFIQQGEIVNVQLMVLMDDPLEGAVVTTIN